jgi:hypothetical protein
MLQPHVCALQPHLVLMLQPHVCALQPHLVLMRAWGSVVARGCAGRDQCVGH